MRPIALGGKSRNADSRWTHCSSNWRRCTRTSVLTPRWAISQAATTVLPKAVVAARTPVSWRSSSSAAVGLLRPQFALKLHVQGDARVSLVAQ